MSEEKNLKRLHDAMWSYVDTDLIQFASTRGLAKDLFSQSFRAYNPGLVGPSGFCQKAVDIITQLYRADRFPETWSTQMAESETVEFQKFTFNMSDVERQVLLSSSLEMSWNLEDMKKRKGVLPRIEKQIGTKILNSEDRLLLHTSHFHVIMARNYDDWLSWYQNAGYVDLPKGSPLYRWCMGDEDRIPPVPLTQLSIAQIEFKEWVATLTRHQVMVFKRYKMDYSLDSWQVSDLIYFRHYDQKVQTYLEAHPRQSWMDEMIAPIRGLPDVIPEDNEITRKPYDCVVDLAFFATFQQLYTQYFSMDYPCVHECVTFPHSPISVAIEEVKEELHPQLTVCEDEVGLDIRCEEVGLCERAPLAVELPPIEAEFFTPLGRSYCPDIRPLTEAQIAFTKHSPPRPILQVFSSSETSSTFNGDDPETPPVFHSGRLWFVETDKGSLFSGCCPDCAFDAKERLEKEFSRDKYKVWCPHREPHYMIYPWKDGSKWVYCFCETFPVDGRVMADYLILPSTTQITPSFGLNFPGPSILPWSAKNGQYFHYSLLSMYDHIDWAANLMPLGFPLFHFCSDGSGYLVPLGLSSRAYSSRKKYRGMSYTYSKKTRSYLVSFGGSGGIGLVYYPVDVFICCAYLGVPMDIINLLMYLLLYDFCTWINPDTCAVLMDTGQFPALAY